jgi:hypothetical protein
MHPCAKDGVAACQQEGRQPGASNAPALYTAIRLQVQRGSYAGALRDIRLYTARFQTRRPNEAAAVRALKKIAEGN